MICRSGKLKTEALGQVQIQQVNQVIEKYIQQVCQNTELQSYFCTKLHCATRAGFLGLYTVTY